MTGLEFEGFENESGAGKQPDASFYIDYSVKLLSLLEGKMKVHNKVYPSKKVSLSQLKDVYSEAGKNFKDAECTCGEWCLARVNMFLRMKMGENVHDNKPERQEAKGLSSLELELGPELYQDSFDVSVSWLPSQMDFDNAKEDILKQDLGFNFKSVSNLYLDNYERIEIDWS